MNHPEVKCLDPVQHKKCFRMVNWCGEREIELKVQVENKKTEIKTKFIDSRIAACNPRTLLENASQFAVYATVRHSILSKFQYLDVASCDEPDEEFEEAEADESDLTLAPVISKVTEFGLHTVFAMISSTRFVSPSCSVMALKALFDVLQGHAPEELFHEPKQITIDLKKMLLDLSNTSEPTGKVPNNMTALSSSCLLSFSIARGDTDMILETISGLIMTQPSLSDQNIQIPKNLLALQKCVQSIILGPSTTNSWFDHGVPHQSLVTSFPVDLPSYITSTHGDVTVKSLASDGCYIYLLTSKGLIKIGTGYGSSVRQHVYMHKKDSFSSERRAWLGYCKDKLYLRLDKKKPELYEVDKGSLEVKSVVKVDRSLKLNEPKSAIFSDGTRLGSISPSGTNEFTITMYTIDSDDPSPLTVQKEFKVVLQRERMLAFGRAPYEDPDYRPWDVDNPYLIQFEALDKGAIKSIVASSKFALLLTETGRVYYCGVPTPIALSPNTCEFGQWVEIKDASIFERRHHFATTHKPIQVAMGHDGDHVVIVLDNGAVLFTGLARKGEDGDGVKYRRVVKPSRLRPVDKFGDKKVVFAACNYGTTAVITEEGQLIMLGKDATNCDNHGFVTELKSNVFKKVALGRAHTVALAEDGSVFTFGFNNKGQCGREFSSSKEKGVRRETLREPLEPELCPIGSHNWKPEGCCVCGRCVETEDDRPCPFYYDRYPKDLCGCGQIETACSVCGICRSCAENQDPVRPQLLYNVEVPLSTDHKADEPRQDSTDAEKDLFMKTYCLPPARVSIPGGQKILDIACGYYHTVLLTELGEVLTFGSNQFGQLGLGDLTIHNGMVRVQVPPAVSIAAGSNHTAVVTGDGELYTFGSFDKGSLGRTRMDDDAGRSDDIVWHAEPGRVSRLGPNYSTKAVEVTASSDFTFVKVIEAIDKPEAILSSTITANDDTIVILPNNEHHTFKCVTINKADGSFNSWTGEDQVDFVSNVASLDPLYNVLWCYQPHIMVTKCYNIQVHYPHKVACCIPEPEPNSDDIITEYPNFGLYKKFADFKQFDSVEMWCNFKEKAIDNLALSNMSILNQELAIPAVEGCNVTRMHAAMHLMGCIDSLAYARDNKISWKDYKNIRYVSNRPDISDYEVVTRFDGQGPGWIFDTHSEEAICFKADTTILLKGIGIYGGRDKYSANVKIYDMGYSSDREFDGEIIVETDEILVDCSPRHIFHILFDNPVIVQQHKWYIAWARVAGPGTDGGENGKALILNNGVLFTFKPSSRSTNGTDVSKGQIPCLLYSKMPAEGEVQTLEPLIKITDNISQNVSAAGLNSLLSLLMWSWCGLKDTLMETNGQIEINFQKLTTMKHQKRLVYIIRASLRLLKSYIMDKYENHVTLVEEVRKRIVLMLADPIPTCAMLPRKSWRNKANRICYVQFALELINSVHKECEETLVQCFYAFYIKPEDKWQHLCTLLNKVEDGTVPPEVVRELTSSCDAMSTELNINIVLEDMVPITKKNIVHRQNAREKKNVAPETSKPATMPRTSNAPAIPPRASRPTHNDPGIEPADWDILHMVSKTLDILLEPLKRQMMTKQSTHANFGQFHDHGELKQSERLAQSSCKLLARMITHIAYNATNVPKDVKGNKLCPFLVTPSRFMRTNPARVWNTSNRSPDALCFTVDKKGISLVGVGIFAGSGEYTYELELLHDDRQQTILSFPEDLNTQCWASVNIKDGMCKSNEAKDDINYLKFNQPIPLKANSRYAIRVCLKGSRTFSGDCGLPFVKGPDGTTFRFMSSSLSFNGTTVAIGQIPCLLYRRTRDAESLFDGEDVRVENFHLVSLNIASLIMERFAELLHRLRNGVRVRELKRNAHILQNSPIVKTLLPFTMASLGEMSDAKSCVRVLELIHKLLPHVTALNQLLPATDDLSNALPTSTTAKYFAYVESAHPYKKATVQNARVLFPSNVSWIVLEMDPRSVTSQPEDFLTVYAVAGRPKRLCHCHIPQTESPCRRGYMQIVNETGVETELFDGEFEDFRCPHYTCTYVPVLPKLSNIHREWPQQAVVVPGNEIIFTLQTASDYLKEFKQDESDANSFGYRCLCYGFDDVTFTTQRPGLVALEMELGYGGAARAARLLAPDIELPGVSQETANEVLSSALKGTLSYNEPVDQSQDATETVLLSRGIELTTPPTIEQVVEGKPLPRTISPERQFLLDFVSAAENTAGGRLARWLSPSPRVEPEKCELKAPTTAPRPAAKSTLNIIIRDQFGDAVMSSALDAKVMVQRLDDYEVLQSKKQKALPASNLPDVNYEPTVREMMRFHAITVIKEYQGYSFEQLRLEGGYWSKCPDSQSTTPGRTLVEKITVKILPDGTSVASWVPRSSGVYSLRLVLDGHPALQEIKVEVSECVVAEGVTDSAAYMPPVPLKLKRFIGQYSAGLRVRSAPSLQSDEMGSVSVGSVLSYEEQLENKDGKWIRLSAESTSAYIDDSASIAWCMQYHRDLNLLFLESVASWTISLMPKNIDSYFRGEIPPLHFTKHPELQDKNEPAAQEDVGSDSSESFELERSWPEGAGQAAPRQLPPPQQEDYYYRVPRFVHRGVRFIRPVRVGNDDNDGDDEDQPPAPELKETEVVNIATQTSPLTALAPELIAMPVPGHRMDSSADEACGRPSGACNEGPSPGPSSGPSWEPSPGPSTARSPEPSPSPGPSSEPSPSPGPSSEPSPSPGLCAARSFEPSPNPGPSAGPSSEVLAVAGPSSGLSSEDLAAAGPSAGPSSAVLAVAGCAGPSSEDLGVAGPSADSSSEVITYAGPSAGPSSEDLAVAGPSAGPSSKVLAIVGPNAGPSSEDLAEAGPSAGHSSELCEIAGPSSEPRPGPSAERSLSEQYAHLGAIPKNLPPPVPARTKVPTPHKAAMSPSQAESLRTVFAALLWHEGIVHDAIAGSAFLKFHPNLPKSGAPVRTRGASNDVTHRQQRHSVEVSSASQYLHIQQSSLEALTRSGIEASSRRREHGSNAEVPHPINEEGANPSTSAQGQNNTVNVLPPALRAMVAIWDTLTNSEPLTAIINKYQSQSVSGTYEDLFEHLRTERRKKNGKFSCVQCELCSVLVKPPIVKHMSAKHRGCGELSAHGYTYTGTYTKVPARFTPFISAQAYRPHTPCGMFYSARYTSHTIFMYCEICRNRELKNSNKYPSKVVPTELVDEDVPEIDHYIMKENALFLLDLAPLTNSEPMSDNSWREGATKLVASSPPAPGSLWQPAPAFQCLKTFKDISPKTLKPEVAKYYSLKRPEIDPNAKDVEKEDDAPASRRLPRSMSMSNADSGHYAGNHFPAAAGDDIDMQQEPLSGAGSSLIAQPSKALLRLVNCEEWNEQGVTALYTPYLDPRTLLVRPVVKFMLSKRDLFGVQQKMDAAIRINTVRQYGFEALNWLLRSVTQPTCVHDVMWWFCKALDKFARLSPEQPTADDENAREVARSETIRFMTKTASAAALCPGGRTGRSARAALHAFLASVSNLTPHLPTTSAATLQAVRCWALHYSPHDRPFLHRSQVFTVISKILSHTEENYEAVMPRPITDDSEDQDFSQDQETYLWSCMDITSWCHLLTSSNLGMSWNLLDGTTETFWECSSENRTTSKWIDVTYVANHPDEKPTMVCFHLDNSRDSNHKVHTLSFMYIEGLSASFTHIMDLRVDKKAADWFCCPLPRINDMSVRIRCEFRTLDTPVRVRGLRVLAIPARDRDPLGPLTPARLMPSLVESETLRVFRLVTSQVFGKLLKWDRCYTESDSYPFDALDSPLDDGDDSDLREHVVGILFAANQLTNLQSRVMSHIVTAIGIETVRSRDDWETNLICLNANEKVEPDGGAPLMMPTVAQDNYCFEMLSLLLALSGSDVGRAHLVLQKDLLHDLLSLLHTGSDRVQRQIILLLRRIIASMSPKRAYAALNIKADEREPLTVLDYLLVYVAKAITVQVKTKGAGTSAPPTMVMGRSMGTSPAVRWFMRSQTSKKHAELVVKLLTDMADGKLGEAWRLETCGMLNDAPGKVAAAASEEVDRSPAVLLGLPQPWAALAALCVIQTNHLNYRNEETERDPAEELREFCSNHEDSETVAVVHCSSCGPLCQDCDRFLHLSRAARTHYRQITKEEENIVRVDLHEGCGRAKLYWLQLLVEQRTFKGLAEFRMTPQFGDDGGAGPAIPPTCRFCGTLTDVGLLAVGNVCSDKQCQEHGAAVCQLQLECGHQCCGVFGEPSCLPCLYGCAQSPDATPLRQDADDMCIICFTEPLPAAPAIQLACGHVFHQQCCMKVLMCKWNGARITFSFSQCPICKENISHWSLDELVAPIRRLEEEVKRKSLMRLEYEGLSVPPSHQDPGTFAMDRYAYYCCFKCGKAYFGGLARCEAESNVPYKPSELVCGACSDVAGAGICFKHGVDFLEYKCRFCCTVAVFFCFGTTHFCNGCHDDFQRLVNVDKAALPKCPAGAKGVQLPGTAEECPLGVSHPPSGEEFALGCGVCRKSNAF